MEPTVAYLSGGRLYVKQPGSPARQIESPFAQQTLARQARQQQIHGWKSRSGVWGSMGMAPPEWSQWEEAGDVGRRAIQFRSIASGTDAGELYYLLDLGDVMGVFRYQLSTDRELRLMHRNAFPACHLACGMGGELVVSMRREDGTIGLAFSQDEGRHWSHVTGGDSRDESPHWMPGQRRVIYQSAQIGRNENGFPIGHSPYAVESLDLEDGAPRKLLETEDHDLLMPRMTTDEFMYFVRRPYRPNMGKEFKPLELVQDVAMFPFRLARALFYYLNFYSQMYSGKPLATSVKQTPWQEREQRMLMLWGHMVDTRKQMSQPSRDGQKHLVPKDWRLVKRAADGSEEIVAEHVVAYDLGENGSLVFTDGLQISYRNPTGRTESLCSHDLIEAVAIVR